MPRKNYKKNKPCRDDVLGSIKYDKNRDLVRISVCRAAENLPKVGRKQTARQDPTEVKEAFHKRGTAERIRKPEVKTCSEYTISEDKCRKPVGYACVSNNHRNNAKAKHKRKKIKPTVLNKIENDLIEPTSSGENCYMSKLTVTRTKIASSESVSVNSRLSSDCRRNYKNRNALPLYHICASTFKQCYMIQVPEVINVGIIYQYPLILRVGKLIYKPLSVELNSTGNSSSTIPKDSGILGRTRTFTPIFNFENPSSIVQSPLAAEMYEVEAKKEFRKSSRLFRGDGFNSILNGSEMNRFSTNDVPGLMLINLQNSVTCHRTKRVRDTEKGKKRHRRIIDNELNFPVKKEKRVKSKNKEKKKVKVQSIRRKSNYKNESFTKLIGKLIYSFFSNPTKGLQDSENAITAEGNTRGSQKKVERSKIGHGGRNSKRKLINTVEAFAAIETAHGSRVDSRKTLECSRGVSGHHQNTTYKLIPPVIDNAVSNSRGQNNSESGIYKSIKEDDKRTGKRKMSHSKQTQPKDRSVHLRSLRRGKDGSNSRPSFSKRFCLMSKSDETLGRKSEQCANNNKICLGECSDISTYRPSAERGHGDVDVRFCDIRNLIYEVKQLKTEFTIMIDKLHTCMEKVDGNSDNKVKQRKTGPDISFRTNNLSKKICKSSSDSSLNNLSGISSVKGCISFSQIVKLKGQEKVTRSADEYKGYVKADACVDKSSKFVKRTKSLNFEPHVSLERTPYNPCSLKVQKNQPVDLGTNDLGIPRRFGSRVIKRLGSNFLSRIAFIKEINSRQSIKTNSRFGNTSKVCTDSGEGLPKDKGIPFTHYGSERVHSDAEICEKVGRRGTEADPARDHYPPSRKGKRPHSIKDKLDFKACENSVTAANVTATDSDGLNDDVISHKIPGQVIFKHDKMKANAALRKESNTKWEEQRDSLRAQNLNVTMTHDGKQENVRVQLAPGENVTNRTKEVEPNCRKRGLFKNILRMKNIFRKSKSKNKTNFPESNRTDSRIKDAGNSSLVHKSCEKNKCDERSNKKSVEVDNCPGTVKIKTSFLLKFAQRGQNTF